MRYISDYEGATSIRSLESPLEILTNLKMRFFKTNAAVSAVFVNNLHACKLRIYEQTMTMIDFRLILI